jgi:flavodoxin
MVTAAVLVDSRGGHTRKMAAAIADELNTTVGDILRPLPEADILFLGSGMYGTGPGLYMNRLLREGTFTGRNVALFATASYPKDGEKMLARMADTLGQKGAHVLKTDKQTGMVILVHFRNVHAEDLDAARKWAREIVTM